MITLGTIERAAVVILIAFAAWRVHQQHALIVRLEAQLAAEQDWRARERAALEETKAALDQVIERARKAGGR